MSYKPLKPSTHMIFWACAFVFFILTVILFKSVLLPFVLGIAVAYLLNPTVNKLGALGIARAPAAMMILGGFLVLIIAAIGVISPVLYREFSEFSEELPGYIEKFWSLLSPLTAQLDQYVSGEDGKKIEDIVKENAGAAIKTANFVVQKLAAGGQAIMDVLSVAIFMPIVAYFMMKEWPSVTKWVQDLMPRHAEEVIMNLIKEIDAKISGFVRGQITVAVMLGVAYAICLTIAGLKYGFLIGLMSGFLSVIPMVGSAVGLVVSIAVAWFQSGDIMFVLMIGGIFVAGQLIEGNFLTPKLVGDSVGLHPLWVFFALLAGGSLLGILGMFLAVPIAAVIGVLLSFAIHKYKQSAYYLEMDQAEEKKKTKVKKSATKSKPKTNAEKPKKTKAAPKSKA
ncbi:MAG: AI-2E family transporter [Alphaproteobacteria bacterium]